MAFSLRWRSLTRVATACVAVWAMGSRGAEASPATPTEVSTAAAPVRIYAWPRDLAPLSLVVSVDLVVSMANAAEAGTVPGLTPQEGQALAVLLRRPLTVTWDVVNGTVNVPPMDWSAVSDPVRVGGLQQMHGGITSMLQGLALTLSGVVGRLADLPDPSAGEPTADGLLRVSTPYGVYVFDATTRLLRRTEVKLGEQAFVMEYLSWQTLAEGVAAPSSMVLRVGEAAIVAGEYRLAWAEHRGAWIPRQVEVGSASNTVTMTLTPAP